MKQDYAVKKIEVGKKKVFVTLNNNEQFSLSYNGYTDHPLYEGKILSNEEYQSLKILAEEDRFINLATRYVLKEAHTIYQTKIYLIKKGADAPMSNRIVARLEESGYLDDKEYAGTFAYEIGSLRMYGKHRILAELKEKGIDESIIAALSFDDEDELRKARAFAFLANRKYASSTEIKKKQKMYYALVQRGFDDEIAKEAMRLELTPMDPELEQSKLSEDMKRAFIRYGHSSSGYELRQKVFVYLARRGYPYENIKAAIEEYNDEDQ